MTRFEGSKRGWRVTTRGKQYLLANLFVLAAAYFVNYSILYLLASFLIMLVIYNYFFLRWTLKNVRVDLLTPNDLFAGQHQDWTLRLENLKRHLPFPAAMVFLGEYTQPGEQFLLPIAPPRGVAESSRRMCCDKRGWFELGEVQIRSGFPFGFIEFELIIPHSFKVLIFPNPLAERRKTSRLSQLSGLLPQNSGDFQYLKPYELGDDVRLIHWRKSTLSEIPVVRRDLVHRDEIHPYILMPDPCPEFELVVRQLTGWVLAGEVGPSWQGWTEAGPHPFSTQTEALTWLATVQPVTLAETLEIEGDQLLRFSEIAESLVSEAA